MLLLLLLPPQRVPAPQMRRDTQTDRETDRPTDWLSCAQDDRSNSGVRTAQVPSWRRERERGRGIEGLYIDLLGVSSHRERMRIEEKA